MTTRNCCEKVPPDGLQRRNRSPERYRRRERHSRRDRRGAARRRAARRRVRLPRPRAAPGQPRRAAARLLLRPDRRRGVPAAVPRPAHRRGPPGRGRRGRYYGGAWSGRTRGLLLHRARRRLPRPRGVAAPARHADLPKTCWSLSEPDERFDLWCAASRSGDVVVVWSGQPRHHRGVGDRRARPRRRAALGGRTPARGGVPRRALARTGARRPAAGGHQRRRPRVPPDGSARPARRRPVRRVAGRWSPRTRPSGWSGSTRSPPTWCCRCAATRGTGCGCCRSTGPPRRPVGRSPGRRTPFEAGTLDLGANEEYDAAAVTVSDQSYVQPAGLLRRGPRDRGARRAAPRGGSGPRPGRLRLRGPQRDRARRYGGAGHRAAAPGHPAGRHRSAAGLRLRRLRVRLRAGVGRRPAEPARPRRRLRARARARRRRGRPALVARRPPARTSRTPSPTTSPSRTVSSPRGSSTGPGSPPGG